MTINLEEYARGIEVDLAELRRMLEPLEDGTMHIRSREFGGEWKDVTAETIDFDKRTIATYEAILRDVRARIEGKP
jgi:CTP-dependent riboflavin kinase